MWRARGGVLDYNFPVAVTSPAIALVDSTETIFFDGLLIFFFSKLDAASLAAPSERGGERKRYWSRSSSSG